MLKKRLTLFLIVIVSTIYLSACSKNEGATTILLNDDPDWSVIEPSRILSCHPYKDSYILVQTTNEVLLLNAETGETIWINDLSDYSVIDDRSATHTGMLVEKDIVITHRGDGAIQSIEADTGKILWEDLSRVGETIDSIYINNDIVVAAIANDRIVAYDMYAGNIKWSIPAPDRTQLYLFGYEEKLFLGTGHEVYDISAGMLSTPVKLDGLVNEMRVASKELYISYVDSSISFSSLGLPSLQPLWKIEKNTVSPLTSITASVSVNDNIVYFTGEDIVAIEKTTGELIWRSSYSDEFGKPMIVGNFLLAQGRQKLYVLDKSEGIEIQVIGLKGGFRPLEWIMYEKVNPCASNKIIWIARGNNLYAYKFQR